MDPLVSSYNCDATSGQLLYGDGVYSSAAVGRVIVESSEGNLPVGVRRATCFVAELG